MQELEKISKECYNYIEEILIKEYGYRYEKLVRDRLSKTNYIFKSLPDTTYFSLKELGYDPKKYKSLEKYYQDFLNYQQVETYLNKKKKKKIYAYLKEKLSLTNEFLSKNLDGILALDYQVFNEDYRNILKCSLNDDLKTLIIAKQNTLIRKLTEKDLPLAIIDISEELDTYISLLDRLSTDTVDKVNSVRISSIPTDKVTKSASRRHFFKDKVFLSFVISQLVSSLLFKSFILVPLVEK